MDMIEDKEHLTKEGFLKILSIKSVFPKVLSDKIKKIYLDIKLYDKPMFKYSKNSINLY